MTKRIFWLVISGYLLVTAYFVGRTYFQYTEQAEQSSLLRLEGIANAIALQIDADVHQKVAVRYPKKDAVLFNTQDTDYYNIHYILARNAEANMVKTPVYTMVLDSTNEHFQFIGTSADTPYYRHEYRTFNPILKEKYTEGDVVPMYKDEFGTWLSAFAPIRDMHGKAVAIVMVDEQFDGFIAKAKQAVVRNLVVSVFIILPFILLLVYLLRRLLARQQKLRNDLENAFQTNLKISE